MIDAKMSPTEVSEARIWRMSVKRNRAVEALDAVLELTSLWPKEAKRLDVFALESKMNAIREATRK